MTGAVVCLDSSAIVKLLVDEQHAPALRGWLAMHPERAASALARTEVVRAVRRVAPAAVTKAHQVFRDLEMIGLDDTCLDAAARLEPPTLRTLDAIHLAAALTLGDDLLAVVTYDDRMAEAARSLGLPVVQPGVDPAIRER